jgi:2,3-bisphosphoglycerate-dependent phosphoglycerate mutase
MDNNDNKQNARNIILIRHGEVAYPLNERGQRLLYGPDVPLSEVGNNQMNQLAATLRQDGTILDFLFSSPYIRAQQSAKPFMKEFGVPIRTNRNLRDVDCQGWVGVTMDELASVGGDIYALPPRSKDQESLPQVVERARDVLSEIVVGKEGMTVGIVSHGDLLSAMNWVLMREGTPFSYGEMVANRYIEKAQAISYQVEGSLRPIREGRLIITAESRATVEGFRNNPDADNRNHLR